MAKGRQCILCETVHSSKQEMDDHMRSMLHHRELEKLKGRDCGHECRVCKVTLGSLTDYAGHISSPAHKQNVEAAEQMHAGKSGREEEYFDQALVDLVEKRKEQIRKEKEASLARQAEEEEERRRQEEERRRQEEERRRQEEFQQRLLDAKERYRLQCSWKQPAPGGHFNHRSWYRHHHGNGEPSPWQHPGKSATWHAQEPPDFTRPNKPWHQDSFHQRSRLPWLSSGGSSNGVYGRNNISQNAPRGRPFLGAGLGPPPNFFGRTFSPFQNAGGEKPKEEPEHNSNRSSKTHGSNPKLDKACRWSPYPVAKGFEPTPHKDSAPKPQKPDKPWESKKTEKRPNPKAPPTDRSSSAASNKDGRSSSSPKIVPKTKSRPETPENQPKISKENRQKAAESIPEKSIPAKSNPEKSNQEKSIPEKSNPEKSNLEKSNPAKSNPEKSNPEKFNTEKSNQKKSNQEKWSQEKSNPEKSNPEKSNPEKSNLEKSNPGKSNPEKSNPEKSNPEKSNPEKSNPEKLNPEKSIQEKLIPEKSNQKSYPEKSNPEKSNTDKSYPEKSNLTKQEVPVVNPEKSNPEKSNPAKSNPAIPYPTKSNPEKSNPEKSNPTKSNPANLYPKKTNPEKSNPEKSNTEKSNLAKSNPEKSNSGTSDSSQFLQSLQVSTSTAADSATANAETEDAARKDETGQSSESDASQTPSGLSKLAPVLKRDLTKHIKSKTGGHEPNLNIARRVRNVSESRRSDTEKDSGLKPTVRQLISASGSRRNVNWDQVYQEVRKKQDKGKGMPRFGIEMVPMEDQSQEDEALPLLEGFQWESLIDVPPSLTHLPPPSRKRSLSESSVAPPGAPSSHALFASLTSTEDGGGEEDVREQPEKVKREETGGGDSGEGAEPVDGQGTGKRRRGAGDPPSAETSCLEHNSKRRKVKSKKERLQIDQLLAVSLREEELSRSLHTVDSSLVQARAALEAAFIEVQRLMVVKQQVTGEMSSLRNKRIELLKGMQGSLEEAPVKLKEEKVDSMEAESHVSSFKLSDAVSVTPAIAAIAAAITAPPRGPPRGPAHRTGPPFLHRPTQGQAGASVPGPGQLGLRGPPCGPPRGPRTVSNRHTTSTWRLQGVTIRLGRPLTPPDAFERPPAPADPPASPSSEQRGGGKRVRKLKKRKVLNKAGGAGPAESSDTEIEASKPRLLRLRRRPSASSQVSTSSTLPSEDKEGDVTMETVEDTPTRLYPFVKLERKDFRSYRHPAPLPKMEVKAEPEDKMAAAAASVSTATRVPDPHNLACNEVTSTSDMDVCRSSESDLPFPISAPHITKMSSDASSDHGEDELPTDGAFEGHLEAVNAMQIYNGHLYSCSGDRTIRAFDLVTHKCVAVLEDHSSKVSCLLVSAVPSLHHRLYSGSSDQTICCYSLKTLELEQQFSLPDRVLCFTSRWRTLYAGLANGTVVTFNLKTNKQTGVFEGHGPRAVSCLAWSQEGARRILLVGSYDSTISVRDAKSGLLLRTLEGHTKPVLCMKVVNDLVFSGSSDQCVYAHNIHTGELVRVYKGHSHAVTVVTVLGKVMVTACLDKLVRVYDLQSQELLQVYGGHRDMVMCMLVHKNMIYSGCYNGSLQAVKLNLTHNYRCWWHGCSLVFGVMDHLTQHLTNQHAGSAPQSGVKCRWKSCEEFCSRSSTKQALLLHMQKHAEEENQLEP